MPERGVSEEHAPEEHDGHWAVEAEGLVVAPARERRRDDANADAPSATPDAAEDAPAATFDRSGIDPAGLDRAGLVVPTGGVHGIVGDADSGIGTLFAVLVGLLRPDAGRARVAGHDPVRSPGDVRARTGWATRGRSGPPELTPRETLHALAAAHGLPADRVRRRRIAGVLRAAALEEVAGRRIARLDGGARRRLAIAQAVVHAPIVLLLDGVLDDLEPEDEALVADLVRGIAAGGTTVLVGADDPAPLAGLCVGAFSMAAGRVVAAHDGRDLAGAGRWRIGTLDAGHLVDALDDLDVAHRPIGADVLDDRRAVEVAVADEREAAALLRRLAARGVPVVEFGRLGPDLRVEGDLSARPDGGTGGTGAGRDRVVAGSLGGSTPTGTTVPAPREFTLPEEP